VKLFPDAARAWFKDQPSRLQSPETIRQYSWILRQVQQSQPSKGVGQFTEDDLFGYVQRGQPSSSLLRQRRKVVIGFFEWAQWKKLRADNPALGVKLNVRPKHQPVVTHRWLTRPETRDLLLSVEGTDLTARRDRSVLLCGLLAGLRRAEMAHLLWSNVDIPNRTFTLVGKGGKLATIGVPTQLRDALVAWRGGRDPRPELPAFCRFRNFSTESLHDPGTRFSSRQVHPYWDLPIGVDGIANIVKRRGKEAGLGHLLPHDLRRTFAGFLEEDGKSILEISRAMRHADVATTQRYLETNPRKTVAVTEDLTI